MGETYNASMESIRTGPERAMQAPPVPVAVTSPVLQFHDMHWKIQADLNGWMTIDVEVRKTKAKWYADLLKPRTDAKLEESRKQDVLAYRMREDYQLRILLAIYELEAAHPLGNRDVAIAVTNHIFPKKEK
jgi:hypothetical protein